MAMTVGDFAIKLGLLGTGKFTSGIKAVDTSIKNLVTSSFFLKTAIAGAIYGLAKMSQAAGNYGLQLSLLQTRTDVSAETFQKFAYAGELAGIKTEETTAAINGLQKAMDEFSVTGEGPQWFNQLFSVVNGDLNKAREPIYMFRKLQEYALATYDKAGNKLDKMQKRLVLGSFGLSDSMIAAMMNGAFNAKSIQEANIVSEKQVKTLAKINTEWAKLKWNLKTFQSQMVATFGQQTLQGLAKLIDSITRLTYTIFDFASKSKTVQAILSGLNSLLSLIADNTEKTAQLILEVEKNPTKALEHFTLGYKPKTQEEINKESGTFLGTLKNLFLPRYDAQMMDIRKNLLKNKEKEKLEKDFPRFLERGLPDILNQPAAPVMNRSSVMNSAADNRRVTINQTNNFTNSDDNPQQIAHATTEAVNGDSFKSQTTAAMRGLIGTAGGY